ncbi:MAG: hypothetical protein EHM15_08745, partial [Desulfobacteraceae bacterium]
MFDRLLKNKRLAVSQGVRRFGKRSIFKICEHLQEPHNGGSQPEAPFFSDLLSVGADTNEHPGRPMASEMERRSMNPTTAGSSSEVELKLKEAETCYSMGMAEEALKLYEHVIASSHPLPLPARQTLAEKVKRLKQEIKAQQSAERQGLSPEDISIFRKTLACQEDVPALLDGAAALKELGLMEEAVTEYEKLLALDHSSCDYSPSDYSPAKIIADYLICLLEVDPPDEVVKKAYKIIYQHNLKEAEAAGLKSWLGRQMESRDQSELAFDLYKTAVEMNPADGETTARLEALKGKLGNTSRYDYLLRSKIVSTQQLQEALAIAKRINRSVEFVLVDRFKIDIREVGQSLSSFYGCAFRQFDPEVPIPFELITNLKKSFLLYYVWVPLKWDKTGIEVLVDDPKDLRKTDHIRALMGNQKIIFAVALKEDVEKYIQLFFDPRAERQTEKTNDTIDDIIPDVSFEEEVEIQEDASLDESSSQVVKFVDQILVTAFRNGASDIHIEPSANTRKTTIRFRTDGVCYEYIQVPNSMAPAIISRLKIMS